MNRDVVCFRCSQPGDNLRVVPLYRRSESMIHDFAHGDELSDCPGYADAVNLGAVDIGLSEEFRRWKTPRPSSESEP